MNFHDRRLTASPRKRRQPHVVLSAQNIARSKPSARERARLAALWVRGDLTITRPPVVLAAHAFDVSASAIYDAIDELDDIELVSPRAAMTPADKVDFVKAIGRIFVDMD